MDLSSSAAHPSRQSGSDDFPFRRFIGALVVGVLLGLLLAIGLQIRHRLTDHWQYTGADGYTYMDAATELAQNGSYGARKPAWYRFQPRVAPLTYCRPPGYPIFIFAVGKLPAQDYATLIHRVQPKQALVDLLTCMLVFGVAYFLGGLVAAFPAMLLAIGSPFLVLYAGSILTETLAIFLTTSVLALLIFALTIPSWRWALLLWGAAGAVTALAALVRADGFLIAPCLLLPLLRPTPPLRRRLQMFALSLLTLAIVFAPWPLRNFHHFGAVHLLDHLCDRDGAPIERTGVVSWLATWMPDEEPLPVTLWCLLTPRCMARAEDFPPEAFDSKEERLEVSRLLLLQRGERFSIPFDEGFRALARQRQHRHPLRSFVFLPLLRAKNLWVSSNDLPLRGISTLPWPKVTGRVRPWLKHIFLGTDALGICGLLALLLLRRWRRFRAVGLLALVALLSRTGYLAFTGYVESRYVLELLPLMLVLCGVAVATGAGLVGAALRWLFAPIRRALA